MKLAAKAVEGFVARPDPAAALILLYGPDTGLVAERARRLALKVVDDLGDPFRVSDLAADRLRAEPQLLAEEAQALCLLGGRRLVRVRQATDQDVGAALRLLAEHGAPAALVLVEAGELGGNSSIRRLVEAAPYGMALPCFRDEDRDLATLIRSALEAEGLTADPDALAYLATHLGSDRAVTRSELDKLAIYIGEREDRRVHLDDASAVVDDNAALAIDDAIHAMLLGEPQLDQRLVRLFSEGQRPEGILRQLTRFMVTLLRLSLQVEAGTPADVAIGGLRPPLFWRTRDTTAAALQRWRSRDIAAALEALQGAELRCRQRGMPAETVCRRVLAALQPRRDAGRAGRSPGVR
ncbi:MAG: DNA polymerase III subunit delta [Geminicoccaceae bacterium]